MGWVVRRPVAHRPRRLRGDGLFGIPFLWVCWRQVQRILAAMPPSPRRLCNPRYAESVGRRGAACGRVGRTIAACRRAVAAWLVPAAALAWIVVSGVGRSLVVQADGAGRAASGRWRMIALQAAWLALLALIFWGWFRSMQWVAATHIAATGEAGPGRLLHLGDLSVAGLLHRCGRSSAGRRRSRRC